MYFAIVLALSFILKISSIGLLAILFRKICTNLFEAFLASWVITQSFIISWMLMLSFFGLLTTVGIWSGLLSYIFVLSSFIFYNAKNRRLSITTHSRVQLSITHIMGWLVALAIFSILTYRSLYYFDNTWDALTYGLPRIALYIQHKSLFVVEPTGALNIFCNEWNGELNALSYVLFTHNNQASSFGNVEIWMLMCLSYVWLAEIFGAPQKLKVAIGLVISSIPIYLGLATTVKGDLLAATCIALGVGFAIRALANTDRVFYYITSATAFGLAAGAKLSVLPCSGLFFLILSYYLLRNTNTPFSRKISACLLMITLQFITNARYIANIFVYANPFKHIEHNAASFTNIIPNLIGLSKMSAEFLSLTEPSVPYAGTGFLLLVMIALFGLYLWDYFFRQPDTVARNNYKFPLAIVMPLTLSFVLFLYLQPWKGWSYRYYTPWLMLGCVYLLSILTKKEFNRLIPVTILLLVCSISNFIYIARPGNEVYPIPLAQAKRQTQMERKLALFTVAYHDILSLKTQDFTIFNNKNILILSAKDSPIYQFFGTNDSAKITLTDNSFNLANDLQKNHYDYVIFNRPSDDLAFADTPPYTYDTQVAKYGYHPIITTKLWQILAYQPNNIEKK